MANKITSFCVVLILILASASAAQRRLNSISELIDCYQNEDTNVWELLHWFASTVNIGRDNRIRLTFDPDHQYGSHHYGNHEGMLSSPPWRHKYYTVGNIHQDISKSLPCDARNARRGSTGWNRARIIFSATMDREINQIFITEHRGQDYDPDRTYEVSTSLILEFRRRNRNEIQQFAERSRRGNAGYTPHLQGYSNNQHGYTPHLQGYSNNQHGYTPHLQGYSNNQHGYTPHLQGYSNNQHRYTMSANTTRAANDDDFLSKDCMVVLLILVVLLIIGFFFLLPFLGNMKN